MKINENEDKKLYLYFTTVKIITGNEIKHKLTKQAFITTTNFIKTLMCKELW